jgi:hypothetical protein
MGSTLILTMREPAAETTSRPLPEDVKVVARGGEMFLEWEWKCWWRNHTFRLGFYCSSCGVYKLIPE